jgi:glucoamylase
MSNAQAEPLDLWADRQAGISAGLMARAISATSLVKARRGFSQTVSPAKGSVLASPESASSDTEPDYFFHWLRDSAAVMDAGLVLFRRGIDAEGWKQRFAEFVAFSLDLSAISGRRFIEEHGDLAARESRTAPKLRQFLRPDAEIAAIEGDSVLGDVRYNADATLDFLKWSRPQHDGVAARALTAMRFEAAGALMEDAEARIGDLIRLDLDYTLKYAAAPCIDIWEEELALHYYTCLMQYAALRQGAARAASGGDGDYAETLRAGADRLSAELERFWSPEKGVMLSRVKRTEPNTDKELDIAVILGVLHAGLPAGADNPHSVADPRIAATLRELEALFLADYALNQGAGAALALGRYRGDSYISGGAFFFSTFGGAEFYYKLAAAKRDRTMIAKGDAILQMARRSIPASGEMAEQFDQTTGEQTSAKNLTWSYASFITAWDARKTALALLAA